MSRGQALISGATMMIIGLMALNVPPARMIEGKRLVPIPWWLPEDLVSLVINADGNVWFCVGLAILGIAMSDWGNDDGI